MAEFQGQFEAGKMPPFAEAVDWFLAKIPMTRAEFEALAAAARAKAFTAAYVMTADRLQQIKAVVLAAIERGETLQDFVKKTEGVLTKAWHRETVFRTNVLSSYGAGHWSQAQELRSLRPYARYSAVMDGRTRPSHAALHGQIHPLNSAFWQRYWPPWDYNCRCAAITLSQGEMAAQGLSVSPAGGDMPPVNPKFQSPAAGGAWQPDYGKYPPALSAALQSRVERAIYD